MNASAGLTLRRAEERDLESIHRIEQACFSDPWELSSIVAALSLPHMQTWVAEQGEGADRRLVGYLIGLLIGSEAEVADLAVDPSVRRMGVGGQLLDCMLNEAPGRGVEVVFLEVRESNILARGLYASRSFREVGRRRGYYRDPLEDALLLRRDLAPS